jgi:hypothetical protein
MAQIETFKGILAWQKSDELALHVYKETSFSRKMKSLA